MKRILEPSAVCNGELRLPPHNRDAERALLGSMLRDTSIIAEAVGLIHANEFYVFAHGIIYRAIADLHTAGKPVDIVTIAEWLIVHKLTDEIGGHGYLAELCDAAPSAGNFRQYAEIVREQAKRRRLICAAREIEQRAADPGNAVVDALGDAERRIAEIAELGTATAGYRSEFPSAVVASALQADANPLAWLWRGFIADKGITLFSALPKVGKTTLLAHLVRNMGNGVALCGYEVTPATVLYITEESMTRWEKRRDALGIGDNVHFIWRPFKGKPSATKWEALIKHLQAEAERIDAHLIVLDTISALWPVRDENDAAKVTEALMPLWNLIERSAVLLVHHLKKGDGPEGTGSRGSGALPGFVDTIMELRRHDAQDRHSRKRIIAGYGRDEETPAEIVVELDGQTNEYRGLGDRKGAKRQEIKRTLFTVLPTERPGMTLDEIKEAWPDDQKPTKATMLDALHEGADGGAWIQDGTGKKGDPYRYHVPSANTA